MCDWMIYLFHHPSNNYINLFLRFGLPSQLPGLAPLVGCVPLPTGWQSLVVRGWGALGLAQESTDE